MIARNPKFKFDPSAAHLTARYAFVHTLNAASTQLPYLEPYLNKVMSIIASKTEDSALKKDIALFMAQEGNHYRQHRMFNKCLEAKYPELANFQERISEDFNRMLSTWSLSENTAYCEGFESLGIIQAAFFFEEMDDLLEGLHPSISSLWKWHLAEEFEHRTVCFDAHFAAGGGYWRRIWGLIYAMLHLGGYNKRVTTYMLSVDRATMMPEEREESIKALKAYKTRVARYTRPRLLRLFSPFYNPREKKMPRGAAVFLAQVEKGVVNG